jgi:hypothetical protein
MHFDPAFDHLTYGAGASEVRAIPSDQLEPWGLKPYPEHGYRLLRLVRLPQILYHIFCAGLDRIGPTELRYSLVSHF